MKRLLLIFFLIMLNWVHPYAQDDDGGNDKIRDKMNEFIQQRLNLTKSESEKFSPVFLRYFKDWIATRRSIRNEPALVQQQKIVDLRIRYRDQFKQIIGEKRSNEVFDQQRVFIQEMQKLRRERLERREINRPGKKQ